MNIRFIFGFAYLAVVGCTHGGSISSEHGVLTYRASHSQDAVLPCGLDKVFLDGPDSFVVWVKDDGDIIYKYPDVKHKMPLVLDHKFKRECTGTNCPDDTALVIHKISGNDAGIYRCRVHYQASPADDYTVRVIVVDSPGQPRLFKETGQEVSGVIGPLLVGDNLTLICKVSNGNTQSSVWWERNGVVMNVSSAMAGEQLTQKIQITNITRAEFNANYVCLSQNADITEPLIATVIVNMILLPLSVDIRLDNNVKFIMHEPRVVDCIIVGCVPPPTVKWFLNDEPLTTNNHMEHHDGNYTVSSLTLTASLKKPQTLTCRAQNNLLSNKFFESKVNVNVGFRPKCAFSGEVVKLAVEDGRLEAAECLIDAYPAPYQFMWYFAFDNSGPYYTNPKPVPGTSSRFSSKFESYHAYKEQATSQVLICTAVNEFGKQDVPCKFIVVKAGPPAQPQCELRARYPSTLIVNCSRTWDGGRPSNLHLEIHNAHGQVIDNYTSEFGNFKLRQQKEGNVTAVVYATNVRGRSKAFVMGLPTLMHLNVPKTTVPALPPAIGNNVPWLGIVMVIISVLVVVQSIAFIKKRCCRKGDQGNSVHSSPGRGGLSEDVWVPRETYPV